MNLIRKYNVAEFANYAGHTNPILLNINNILNTLIINKIRIVTSIVAPAELVNLATNSNRFNNELGSLELIMVIEPRNYNGNIGLIVKNHNLPKINT